LYAGECAQEAHHEPSDDTARMREQKFIYCLLMDYFPTLTVDLSL